MTTPRWTKGDRMLEMLEAARAAAMEGARVLVSSGCDSRTARTKSSGVDLVTDADIASGEAVVRAIASRYPDARFVVEETEVYGRASVTHGDLSDPEVWVVDPLDGTTSFVHGYPFYSISIALLRDGRPVLGVVHDVPSGETFAAVRGMGATLDDRPIRCSSTSRLDKALLVTGFPYDRTRTLERQMAVFSELMKTVHGVRRDGSAALDCCHVAAGRADGFWEFGLQVWDTAAGVVILEEAGARVTDISGAPWSTQAFGFVAANPTLHERLLEVVTSKDPGA